MIKSIKVAMFEGHDYLAVTNFSHMIVVSDDYCYSLMSMPSLVPRPPDLFFNVHERKRGSLGSNVTWQMLAWRHEREAVNSCWCRIGSLQFIKHSCLRPSRILRHLLEGFGTISSIHIELERLKIWLAHMQFSWSATLPTLIYELTSLMWRWIPDSPSFSHVRWKRLGSLGTRLVHAYL